MRSCFHNKSNGTHRPAPATPSRTSIVPSTDPRSNRIRSQRGVVEKEHVRGSLSLCREAVVEGVQEETKSTVAAVRSNEIERSTTAVGFLDTRADHPIVLGCWTIAKWIGKQPRDRSNDSFVTRALATLSYPESIITLNNPPLVRSILGERYRFPFLYFLRQLIINK